MCFTLALLSLPPSLPHSAFIPKSVHEFTLTLSLHQLQTCCNLFHLFVHLLSSILCLSLCPSVSYIKRTTYQLLSLYISGNLSTIWFFVYITSQSCYKKSPRILTFYFPTWPILVSRVGLTGPILVSRIPSW